MFIISFFEPKEYKIFYTLTTVLKRKHHCISMEMLVT